MDVVTLCTSVKKFQPVYRWQLSIFKLVSLYQQVLHVSVAFIRTSHNAALSYQIKDSRKLEITD